MFNFQATLQARAPEVTPGISLELRGLKLPTLIVPPAALAHPFGMTFEDAALALESLERMFVEPDGSFVWVSSNNVLKKGTDSQPYARTPDNDDPVSVPGPLFQRPPDTASDETSERWQIDGNLFDRNGRLLMVDLKGTCAEAEFDQLLAAFGWPTTPVMFQLAREAVFLNEPNFRRYARL